MATSNLKELKDLLTYDDDDLYGSTIEMGASQDGAEALIIRYGHYEFVCTETASPSMLDVTLYNRQKYIVVKLSGSEQRDRRYITQFRTWLVEDKSKQGEVIHDSIELVARQYINEETRSDNGFDF